MTGPAAPTVVPILLWHAIGPVDGDPFRVEQAAYERHLDLVRATGRTPLTATELAQALAGRRPLPAAPVLLTFDDGFADLADVSVPALLDRGLRATVFATSGFLGRPGYLDAAALRAISGADVEIGAHSVTHPHLDVLSPRQAREEIVRSRRDVEDVLGVAVTSFAYPHGSHSRRTRALVAAAGYSTAHAVKNALSHADDDVFAVARYTVHAGTTDDQVAAVLAGRGAPLSWPGERLRTRGYRLVRRYRWAAGRARSRRPAPEATA